VYSSGGTIRDDTGGLLIQAHEKANEINNLNTSSGPTRTFSAFDSVRFFAYFCPTFFHRFGKWTLKAAAKAVNTNQPIDLSISLKGFSAAFDRAAVLMK
jgi:hypothetical protein